MEKLNENVKVYKNGLVTTKKQLDVLFQQQKQYKNEKKQGKVEYKEQLDILHQQQDQYKDENKQQLIAKNNSKNWSKNENTIEKRIRTENWNMRN